ncbi:MAG: restriction endonuclease subunit R, partial [Alphaproteobacteria bacterium]
LERDFMIACDADTGVERFVKINENKHTFAHLRYLRTDGMLSSYYPDFLVKCGNEIFVVETKSDKDAANDANVKKKQLGALDWVEKINALSEEDRMNAEWKYALLDETTFYGWKRNGATIKEILTYVALKKQSVTGELDL